MASGQSPRGGGVKKSPTAAFLYALALDSDVMSPLIVLATSANASLQFWNAFY
jgi:hypothetical protein